MKKRTIAIALVALLAVAAVPAIAFASVQANLLSQEPAAAQDTAGSITAPVPDAVQGAAERASVGTSPVACGGYVDANGDGMCDACGTGAYGTHHHGYVDADNDGVCDNYAAGTCDGTGCAAGGATAGQNHGCGNGAGYVDADGNGTCDNYDTGTCPGNGAGHGHGSGNGTGRGHHGHGC